MKIAVLNGSPKGELSVSFQYVRYLAKRLPQYEFETFNVGLEAAKMAKHPEAMDKVLESLRSADCILWCFPVYVLGLPSQLHHFLDLVVERGLEGVFASKYATALTTSVHFYDHTAHQLMHAISEDLNMLYIEGYSADMRDLRVEPERQRLVAVFTDIFRAVEAREPVERRYPALTLTPRAYRPEPIQAMEKNSPLRGVILTDARDEDVNLQKMMEVYQMASPMPLEVIRLADVPMQGGCLGCMQCADDGTCCYKDGFSDFYRQKLMSADVLIFASRLEGRTYSTLWKRFLDRGFFNGHRPVLKGKRVVHLVSGPLRQLPLFREMLDAKSQLSGLHLIGVISDDEGEGALLTERITLAARRAAGGTSVARPGTFLEVGGFMVFRDLVYGYRAMFRADYRFYKAAGLVRYPVFSWREQLSNLFTRIFLWIPGMKKEFYRRMKVEMVKPLQRIVEDPNK